ncbi:hypothetical protein LguiA_035866 [Lonicera macranthoides]
MTKENTSASFYLASTLSCLHPGSEGASLLPSGTNESLWQLLRNLHLLVPVHL